MKLRNNVKKVENEFFEADAQFEARTDALKKEYETTLQVRIDVLEQELGREKESAIRSLEEAQKLQLEEMRTYFADETAEMKLRNNVKKVENEFFEADAQFEARTDALKKEYET